MTDEERLRDALETLSDDPTQLRDKASAVLDHIVAENARLRRELIEAQADTGWPEFQRVGIERNRYEAALWEIAGDSANGMRPPDGGWPAYVQAVARRALEEQA